MNVAVRTLWRTVKRRWGRTKSRRASCERTAIPQRKNQLDIRNEISWNCFAYYDLSWDHRINTMCILFFPSWKEENKREREKKNDTLYSEQSDCATSSGSLRSIAIWMTRGIQMEGRIVSPLCLANVTISNSVAIKLSRAFGFCH